MHASVFMAAVASLLIGCSSTNRASSTHEQATGLPRLKTVRHDIGGAILPYALKARKIEEQGRVVRFAGRCDSACTLYLSMPRENTCISPGASFGFHLPKGKTVRSESAASAYLLNSYPYWVREWVGSNGGLNRRIKVMRYDYASGFLRRCQISDLTVAA